MKVAVIAGGPSSEAEVSRISAAAVAGALTQAGHQVERFELDATLAQALLAFAPEVVFPVCHGAVGEDGSLQGLLEVLALPYVGSAVLASALAMDKPTAKQVFAAAGLPLARGVAVRSTDEAEAVVNALGRSLVVKPAAGGSALGVTRLSLEAGSSTQPLRTALNEALASGPYALVEELVVGDEVTCGVLEREGAARALPPTRIEALGASFYDFHSRYAKGKSAHTCPAPYPSALLERIGAIALAAHRALGCRDLSRSDFVVVPAEERVVLLETNTMPGFTATSLFPEAAQVAGYDFMTLCDGFVRAAAHRGRPRRSPAAAFPT